MRSQCVADSSQTRHQSLALVGGYVGRGNGVRSVAGGLVVLPSLGAYGDLASKEPTLGR